jgi:hypothetical protein
MTINKMVNEIWRAKTLTIETQRRICYDRYVGGKNIFSRIVGLFSFVV